MEITNQTSYEDIKKEINDINCKAWYKLITKELSGLKKSLEIEMDYIDEILFCENKMFSENNKDTTIENLEYIIKDFKGSTFESYGSCNIQTLEIILKEIKGHE